MNNAHPHTIFREDFMEAHGGLDKAVVSGEGDGFYLFPDGAMCERSAHGIVMDPPKDEKQRLKRILEHRYKAMTRAIRLHEKLEHQIIATFDPENPASKTFCGQLFNGSEEEALEELRISKKHVRRLRREWNLTGKALEALDAPDPQVVAEQKRLDEQEALHRVLFRAKLLKHSIHDH